MPTKLKIGRWVKFESRILRGEFRIGTIVGHKTRTKKLNIKKFGYKIIVQDKLLINCNPSDHKMVVWKEHENVIPLTKSEKFLYKLEN